MDYEETLATLLGYIGQPVAVVIGPRASGGYDAHMHAMLRGVLERAEPDWLSAHLSAVENEEALAFKVGEAGEFFVYRSRLGEAEDLSGERDGGGREHGIAFTQDAVSIAVWREDDA